MRPGPGWPWPQINMSICAYREQQLHCTAKSKSKPERLAPTLTTSNHPRPQEAIHHTDIDIDRGMGITITKPGTWLHRKLKHIGIGKWQAWIPMPQASDLLRHSSSTPSPYHRDISNSSPKFQVPSLIATFLRRERTGTGTKTRTGTGPGPGPAPHCLSYAR